MRWRILIACLAACVAALACVLLVFEQRSIDPEVNMSMPSPAPTAASFDDDGFPEIDWEYWASINPAILGWVSIPGTNVDQPIVQAPLENPQFYLSHDIFNELNPIGCPYLDAGCSKDGLSSQNAVISGHNMGGDDQSMFGDIELYSSGSFAVRHAEILLQTPSWKKRLAVVCVDILPGWEAEKRLDFGDPDDFERYLNRCYSRATVQIKEPDPLASLYTFCACSYNYGANERTIVYAQEVGAID